VKNIVEEQIMKKDREISSLRQQLNVHAQHQVCTIIIHTDNVLSVHKGSLVFTTCSRERP